jgi:hypothetical protein
MLVRKISGRGCSFNVSADCAGFEPCSLVPNPTSVQILCLGFAARDPVQPRSTALKKKLVACALRGSVPMGKERHSEGVRMKPIDRWVKASVLGICLVGISGCMENIALIGRPTIEEGQNDVVGEVDRVDLPSRQIYFRPNTSDRPVVAFSADAQVLDHGREYPVTRLKPGDLVALQMKRDARGDAYTDLIRVQDRAGNQNQE